MSATGTTIPALTLSGQHIRSPRTGSQGTFFGPHLLCGTLYAPLLHVGILPDLRLNMMTLEDQCQRQCQHQKSNRYHGYQQNKSDLRNRHNVILTKFKFNE